MAFTMYHQHDGSPDFGTYTTPSICLANGRTWSSANAGASADSFQSDSVDVSATVEPIQWTPILLVNASGEVENLNGYGYRYTGEQRFYSFYVNLPNGPSAPTKAVPFQSGVNLVLESRSAFLNSTLGSTLNGSNGLPPSITNCFGSSAQITTQDPGSTDFTSIVGSFSADQVATSCAMTLLGELEPLSANRTNHDPPMGGTYVFLSPVQAELLGLDGQALALMPFQSPPTSPTGGPPTNDLGSAFGYVVGAFAFAYNALVTGVNFIAHLPAELKALGQIILGAIEKVLSAVETAVQWLASHFFSLVDYLIGWLSHEIGQAVQYVVTLAHGYEENLNSAANNYIGAFENNFSSQSNLSNTVNQTAFLFSAFLGGGEVSNIFDYASSIANIYEEGMQVLLHYVPPTYRPLVSALMGAFTAMSPNGGVAGPALDSATSLISALGASLEFNAFSGFLGLFGLSNKVISSPPGDPMPYADNRTDFVDATNKVAQTNTTPFYGDVLSQGKSNITTASELVRLGMETSIFMAVLFGVAQLSPTWKAFEGGDTVLPLLDGRSSLYYEGETAPFGKTAGLDIGLGLVGLAVSITALIIGGIVLTFESDEKYHAADGLLLSITIGLDVDGAVIASLSTKENPYIVGASVVAAALGFYELRTVFLHG